VLILFQLIIPWINVCRFLVLFYAAGLLYFRRGLYRLAAATSAVTTRSAYVKLSTNCQQRTDFKVLGCSLSLLQQWAGGQQKGFYEGTPTRLQALRTFWAVVACPAPFQLLQGSSNYAQVRSASRDVATSTHDRWLREKKKAGAHCSPTKCIVSCCLKMHSA
jgi:hypothetical protein